MMHLGTSSMASRLATAALPAVLLAGCAGASSPSATSAANRAASERVIVKLVHPSDDRDRIADEAARRSGVAVSYVAAVSSAWHALALRCDDAARCAAAVERLRAERSVYETVEVDRRKRASPDSDSRTTE